MSPDQSPTRPEAPEPLSRLRRSARGAAVFFLALTALAVLWPSGSDIADVKETIGPWFLGAVGKDVVLNLVMLAPFTFCAVIGWPQTPWWVWAVLGCEVSLASETAQALLPVLHRRAKVANILQNSTGAWVGAACGYVAARFALHRAARRQEAPREQG